jgi:two-component system NtrC family sensor kinase
MPGAIDGIQLAFRLRELVPALPVVLTTGYASRVDEAKAAGFRVLAKPVEWDELLAELASHCGVEPAAGA